MDDSAKLRVRETGPSSERNSMARKRYQHGSVCLVGKNKDRWAGRYREDVIGMDGTVRRVRREVILGRKIELPTKRLAQRRMETVLFRINRLDYTPGRIANLEEFADRWKAEVLITQRPSSARAVKSHLKCYIIPQLGELRLDQLGVEKQQSFIASVHEKGASRKTVLNILGTLSSILTTARNWGYNCELIDMKKLRLPARGEYCEAPYFTAEQVQRILAVAEEPWRTLFCILAMEGLRAGEALGLQWGDIDTDRRLLHVRRSAWYGKTQTTKTKGSASVLPIPASLLATLENYRVYWDEHCKNPEGFLFVTRNGRPPSSNKVVEYRLWSILDALGIPRCGLHAFRHAHTALLLDAGANAKVVQRQLRHADARTTLQIYAHVVGDAQRQAVERLALLLDGSGFEEVAVSK